jgi:hypothetical protein
MQLVFFFIPPTEIEKRVGDSQDKEVGITKKIKSQQREFGRRNDKHGSRKTIITI